MMRDFMHELRCYLMTGAFIVMFGAGMIAGLLAKDALREQRYVAIQQCIGSPGAPTQCDVGVLLDPGPSPGFTFDECESAIGRMHDSGSNVKLCYPKGATIGGVTVEWSGSHKKTDDGAK